MTIEKWTDSEKEAKLKNLYTKIGESVFNFCKESTCKKEYDGSCFYPIDSMNAGNLTEKEAERYIALVCQKYHHICELNSENKK